MRMSSRTRRGWMALVGGLVLTAAPVPTLSAQLAHAAVTTTVVTIQFDDGSADQYQTLAILNAHGMHATFYVNSGVIGDADHMTWKQLSNLYAAGNEIAGHTIDHANIKKLKPAAARHEVCDDRVAIYDHGLNPVSFAYPFGSFDAGSEQVVHDCGYNSGRGVSGVDDRKTFAETIPPLDPYATRTPPNPKQGTTLKTIQSYVLAAEQNGGGWIQLVFHHVCASNCDAYSLPPWRLRNLLTWLQPRAARGTVVQTTAQVVGGPVQPPVPA
jgi:peptidoglycan/xylan/chitin deacetylase (PgdA/CDA1 family)